MRNSNPFRASRESKGLTLRELALQADLSERVVCRFECDNLLDCRPKTRLKLARGYGVSIEEVTQYIEGLRQPVAAA